MSPKARYHLILPPPPPPLAFVSVAQILYEITVENRNMWQKVDGEANQEVSHCILPCYLSSDPCTRL